MLCNATLCLPFLDARKKPNKPDPLELLNKRGIFRAVLEIFVTIEQAKVLLLHR